MSDTYSHEEVLCWLAQYGTEIKVIELVASSTLFSFKSSCIYNFEMPMDALDRIVIKCQGRELTEDNKSLLEDGVSPEDVLEVILLDPKPR